MVGGLGFVSPQPGSVTVRIDKSLPFPKTVKACDIELRLEVEIPTGEMIDFYKLDNTIYVSEKFYEKIKEEIPNQK